MLRGFFVSSASLILAAALGALAAAAGIILIDGAAATIAWRQHPLLLLTAPAIAGLVGALIARRLPNGTFLGLADMITQVQYGKYHPWRQHALSFGAAAAALVGGASVGQYGPVAHLGGMLGGFFRRLPPRTAAACGIAAAVAAAFNAPFTGLVFAHEVILRHYSLRAFTPVAIAAVTGYSVSVGIFDRHQFLELPAMTAPLNPLIVLVFIFFGGGFGALAAAYVRGIFWLDKAGKRIPALVRLPAAGLATGALMLAIPELAGGDKALLVQVIEDLITPADSVVIILAKIAATVLCLGFGFAGGVVSPTLVIGALTGLLFFFAADALLPALQLLPAEAALCGMMALTAPVIGAPLAGILFVMELSGSYSIAIAAAVAIAVSMRTAIKLGGHSYYNRQLIQRGIDPTLRRDQWLLRTETIAALVRPPALVLPATLPLAEAIQRATTSQPPHSDIYLDDDEQHGGSVLLADALAAQQRGARTLAEAAASIQPPYPVLTASATLFSAIETLETFSGDTVAVVNDSGNTIGTLSKGALLKRYNELVLEHRHEESAVT